MPTGTLFQPLECQVRTLKRMILGLIGSIIFGGLMVATGCDLVSNDALVKDTVKMILEENLDTAIIGHYGNSPLTQPTKVVVESVALFKSGPNTYNSIVTLTATIGSGGNYEGTPLPTFDGEVVSGNLQITVLVDGEQVFVEYPPDWLTQLQ